MKVSWGFALVGLTLSAVAAACSSSNGSSGGGGSSSGTVCTGIAGGSGTSACSSCLDAMCSSTVSTFQSECSSFLSCAADCGCGQSCVDSCEAQLMTSSCEGAADTFAECVETTCAADCETTGTATVIDAGNGPG